MIRVYPREKQHIQNQIPRIIPSIVTFAFEGKKDKRSKSSIRVIRDESRKGRSKGVVVKERQPAVYTMAVQGG